FGASFVWIGFNRFAQAVQRIFNRRTCHSGSPQSVADYAKKYIAHRQHWEKSEEVRGLPRSNRPDRRRRRDMPLTSRSRSQVRWPSDQGPTVRAFRYKIVRGDKRQSDRRMLLVGSGPTFPPIGAGETRRRDDSTA